MSEEVGTPNKLIQVISKKRKFNAPFKSPLRKLDPKKSSNTCNEADLTKEIVLLEKKKLDLENKIKMLNDKGYKVEELDDHIKYLHSYNEMKDMGQALIGVLAFKTGTTTKALYEKFDLDLDD